MSLPTGYNQRPLLIIAISAYLGILLSAVTQWSGYVFIVISLINLLMILLTNHPRLGSIAMVSLYFWLFAGLGAQSEHNLDLNTVQQLDQKIVIMEGHVIRAPYKLRSSYGWKSILSVSEIWIENQRAQLFGKVNLAGYRQSEPGINIGDKIKVKGLFRGFSSPVNPGQFDYSRYMTDRHFLGQLIINQGADLEILSRSGIYHPFRLLGSIKNRINFSIEHYFPHASQPWILALLLGERTGLDPVNKQLIGLSGLAHILAISGLHLTIIFFFILSCFKLLPIATIYAQGLALLVVLLMTTMINGPVSALRAVIMLSCSLVVWLQIGKKDTWSAWALAGLGLMLINPRLALQAGFQLSFVATAAILLSWPYLPKIKQPYLQWISHLMVISTAIFILTSPLTIYHFNMITPISVLTNIIAIPLLAISLILSWCVIFISFVTPSWAVLLGELAGWFISQLEQLALFTAQLSWGHYFIKSPPALVLLVWYGLIILVTRVSLCVQVRLALIGGWSLGMMIGMVINQVPPAASLTALALNKGEAFLIRTKTSNVLIDTGTQADFIYQVYPYLKYEGINHLDALIITHQDADHSGGLSACLKMMSVDTCLFAGSWLISNQKIVQLIGRRGVNLQELVQGQTWQGASQLSITSMWPRYGGQKSSNNSCLVAQIKLFNHHLLFTGDSPAWIEEQWMNLNSCLLLKAGHHGDHKSTGNILLERLSPELVLVSAGSRNPYGLPDPRMINRVTEHQSLLMNTYQQGAIKIVLDQRGIQSWQCWK